MSNNIKVGTFKNLIEGIKGQLNREITLADIAIVNQEKLTLSGAFELSAVKPEDFAKKVTEDGPIFESEVGIIKAEDMGSTPQPSQPVNKRPKM